MRLLNNLCRLLSLIFLTFVINQYVSGQATVGDLTKPHDFSILELTTNKVKGGLRLPQLTTDQRDALFATTNPDPSPAQQLRSTMDEPDMELAYGLTIFNIDINCVEIWNGTKWISLCKNLYIPPIGVIISPEYQTIEVGSLASLTATVNPSNATFVEYFWERSDNGVDWYVVEGEITTFLKTRMMILGEYFFRVTAYNEAGTVTSKVATVVVEDVFPGTFINNPSIQMYIGAFWRNNEKGERLIQFKPGASNLNNHGDWMASVMWYDSQWNPEHPTDPDGVILENSTFTIPKNGSAEDFLVPASNGSQIISGNVVANGTATFRIGLNKPFGAYNSNSNPARYAVVLLVYGINNTTGAEKKQKMFLRQGEGDDYVMRPDDPGIGVPAGRPAARKFSPYNLRDESGATPNNYGNATPLGKNGGSFTDYPTKAGYFFVFSDTKAFTADVSNTVNSWNQNVGFSNLTNNAYWNTDWETCPVGYRRPTDGANNTTAHGTGVIAGSEIRQSLWVDPPTIQNEKSENTTWGYYADGYFDRRALQSSTGTSQNANSAVSASNINVAYIGKLFFNPTTNASLFFPAVGYRYHNNGELFDAGGRARYWTSTSHSNNNPYNGWFLYFYSNTRENKSALYNDSEVTNQQSRSKASGAMVRCVKD